MYLMNILEYENYQEKISHGNPLFPYITYLCSIPLDFSYVPIHWHDEMELIYIKKGHGIITVDFTQYQVSAGTLALIIPGQLHSIEQYENESMEYENIIFHPQILLSKQTDTCSTDYFSPLMDGTLTVPVLYQPGDPYYGEISACVDANDEISKTNPPAYQLFIKSQLFMLFTDKNPWLWRAILVPAVSFVGLSVVRKIINAPRPYEKFDMPPVLEKDTKGKSFPSRHVFSVFIIAMTIFYEHPGAGVLLGIIGLLLGIVRVLVGVHEPKDIIVGALAGIVCGIVGYYVI